MSLFFNLQINKKLEKEIINETNQLIAFVDIKSVSDCHFLFLSYFDIYNGSYSQELDKILESWFTLLLNHTCFTAEYILINIAKFYYDHGSKDLATSYVQNHDFENSLNNKINFIGKNKQEKIDNAYYYFLDIAKQEIDQSISIHLNEILFPISLIDKDVKYSVKQQKSSLIRTLKLLQTYKFQNIEDEYKQLLASIDTKINSTAKSNTLLKLLRESELNDLTGNENIGLYYIHIVNIIYGFFILKDRMTKYKKLLSILKYEIQNIKDAVPIPKN